MKFFCRTGPIQPKYHYFIPQRLNWEQVNKLIGQLEYFILHAPRQSGKTTAIEEFIRSLNGAGQYRALYINVESSQACRDNVKEAVIAILGEIRASLRNQLPDDSKTILHLDELLQKPQLITSTSFMDVLEFWSQASSKPAVLFIDEIDALMGDSLLTVLHLIRRGFSKRPTNFPQSICLIGLRDVRDYRIWSKEAGEYVSGASPFNIKAESIVLRNFSPEEVAALFKQHTQETGQVFEKEAIDYAFYLTQGQPWLVNALAYQAAFVLVEDRSRPITKDIIEQAKEILIKRRDTHIDSLLDKLREDRVTPIIDAIIEGKEEAVDFNMDDLQYVRDLGLIKQNRMEIANPIYQEIIPRELTAIVSEGLAERFVNRLGYVRPDGSLDMQVLLDAFTEFYRENTAIWLEQFAYKESGPHLLLMAFLQRIINGGGTIIREYALGRDRVDLLIKWRNQRIVLEIKVRRKRNPLKKGLEQTTKYMNTSQASEGYLIIFDRDHKKAWNEKIQKSKHNHNGFTVHVLET